VPDPKCRIDDHILGRMTTFVPSRLPEPFYTTTARRILQITWFDIMMLLI
jgi:hypothetical protein